MLIESPSLPEMVFDWPRGAPLEECMRHEWLVTNGLGAYASGTVAACNTRRYHGIFTPSLPVHGRTVMIPRVAETATVGDESFRLDGEELEDGLLQAPSIGRLKRFELHGTLPEWTYDLGQTLLQRTLVFVHMENTLFVAWRNLGGAKSAPVRLRVRPYTAFRFHDKRMPPTADLPVVHLHGDRIEVKTTPEENAPPLRLRVVSSCPTPFVGLLAKSPELLYRVELARGLDHTETQLSPGYFECTIKPGETLFLGATVESWDRLERDPNEAFHFERDRQKKMLAHAPPSVRHGTGARLVLAADQFIIRPSLRPQDEAWARGTGQHARSVIAGYPWFTDWGRDTMISLEGLTLATGRTQTAGSILRTFEHYVKDGLLPNLFPEGNCEGLYHTADATLWFFHAINRYLGATGDMELLRDLWPTLVSIIDHHQKGTRFGIHVDPKDGLLAEGAEGYQLTWMDAKVDGWVVTPRRGKPVEINALFYNALALMQGWAKSLGVDPTAYAEAAEKARAAFNGRFWNEARGCLYDVLDGPDGENDPKVRPNQIFAISLDNPVLDRKRWDAVIACVERDLLTPVGLRSLAPFEPDFKPTYDGDLRARDAAYHQGTVWAWLIGHYVDAVRKLNPDRKKLRALLSGLEAHLREAGLGTVSEIFDATDPFRPRGCFAQAWSVAELLRCWLSLGGDSPDGQN